MRLANSETINLLNVIGSIADKDIPIALTYRLFDINKKLQDSYDVYYNTLQNIMKKKDIDNPDDKAIQEEVKELLGMIVDVDIQKISRDELIKSNIDLTLAQLSALSPIIEG